MSNKEEKKKRKEVEKAVREYKQWELDQKQYYDDFQMMEDYLEALSKQLKGGKQEETAEENPDDTAEAKEK